MHGTDNKNASYVAAINIHHVRSLEEGQGLNLGRGILNPNVVAVIITVTCEVFSVVLNYTHILKYMHIKRHFLWAINFSANLYYGIPA